MAETPILSCRRPFPCPAMVSAIFGGSFLALTELSIRGGRKQLLEPLLGKAFITRGSQFTFPREGIETPRSSPAASTWRASQFTFPREGIETFLLWLQFGRVLRHNSLFPARGLKHLTKNPSNIGENQVTIHFSPRGD